MESRVLAIEEKLKEGPGAVRPSDFRVRDVGVIDPRIVIEQPNLSLYCLDFENRCALFVETPHEFDLDSLPFLYRAQYESAIRLVQVPFDTLHRLAAEVALDLSRLILIYSTGRCGSTLVSRAFNEIEGVASLSEPDVFTQLLSAWGKEDLDNPEKAELLKSCTLLQCAPARLKHKTAWVLKFRSMVTHLWPLFSSTFPEAKVIFLYRNAEPWARSFLRIMRVPDPLAPIRVENIRGMFGRGILPFENQETIPALELVTAMWVTVMEECLAMQHRGIPMFVARYEELNEAPREVLLRMFAHCSIAMSSVGSLDAVLQQDSQAGSTLSRENLSEAPIQVSREHLDQMRRLIENSSPRLTADTILPGTYFPAKQNSP